MLAQTIRTLFEVGTVAALSDGQLLDRFASAQDEAGEAAFAALVARHGPMVLSVCRGVLGTTHDAEDAFQATFLVLAKKARLIRDPDLLGNWLYGVARRTAQKSKARQARTRLRTQREAAMSSIAVENGLAELRPIQGEETAALHEELDRLPHALRVPIVLCYLEGLTHAEAARRLRWPVGTVRSRMARARGLLRSRLTRRGLAYAGVAIGSETSRAVMADVPRALTERTTRSAIALAAGTWPGFVSTSVAALTTEVLRAAFVGQLEAHGRGAARSRMPCRRRRDARSADVARPAFDQAKHGFPSAGPASARARPWPRETESTATRGRRAEADDRRRRL